MNPYEGRHLIADLHGCTRLDDADYVEDCLLAAAGAAGATILESRMHSFGPGHGVTGMVLLAESHISIHTWPEHGYAAVDIFLCGRSHDLDAALASIAQGLGGTVAHRTMIARGYSVMD